MEFMGTKEAAKKWGYSQSTIARWCRENRIDGAEHDDSGSPWRIPVNAKCPVPHKVAKACEKGKAHALCISRKACDN